MPSRNKITINDWTFEHDDIDSGNCYQTISLLSESLEINDLKVTVRSPNNLKTLPRDTPLTYFYDNKQVGIFYIQTVERTGPTAYDIYAISTVGLLDKTDHYGGIYTGKTADEIISDICGDVPYTIKSSLKNEKLYGWLPIASRRANLSQVLFALGATLKTDLLGVLRIESLWDGLSGSITQDQIYSGGSVDYEDVVTNILVTEHQYAEGGDSEKLFEGTTQQGDIITFGEPMYNLTAAGFTILERGANYAKVSSGTGTLTGNKYIHLTREIVRTVDATGIKNTKAVKEATLVSLVNSSAVAERLVNYYKCREVVNTDVLYEGEQTGSLVQFYHPYDKIDAPVCLQEVDINLSNTLAAHEKGVVGFKPLLAEQVEIFDEQEILTTSVQWVVPEGVTSIRAALMSAGDGGGAGFDGAAGSSGANVSSSSGTTGTKSGQEGKGGDGGESGAPGAGGKINIVDIEVTPGEVLTVTIGKGGDGGAENGQAGAAGTPTTITRGGQIFTSADGSTSPSGYVDLITGQVFALPGKAGQKGADGGDGSTSGKSAESGDSVPDYSGGSAGSGSTSSRTLKKYASPPTVSQSWGGQSSIGTINGNSRAGRTGYSVDSTSGAISLTGSTITIGYYLSQLVKGIIYENVRNGGVPDVSTVNSDTTVYSYVDEIEATSTNFLRRTLTVTRVYRLYKVDITKGTYSGGGGGAAPGAAGGGASTYGGNGADAAQPQNATVPGSGGNAGHGGGGGGGGGGGYLSITGTPGDLSYGEVGYGGSGGSAGKGSKGGHGADGAAIFYFGVPHKVKAGPVVTSDGRFFLDLNKRRVVV